MDHQAPILPSVEVLVKALIVISSAAVTGPPSSWIVRAIFCSHHPSIVGTGKKDAVWKVILTWLILLIFLLFALFNSDFHILILRDCKSVSKLVVLMLLLFCLPTEKVFAR